MLSCKASDNIKLAIPRPKIDGPKLFNLLDKQREYFEYYLPWLKLTKVVNDEVEFLQMTNRHMGTNDALNLVIWYQNEVAGMISFNHFDNLRASADIGYWLGREFQGKGIMTKAVKCFVNLGFEDYGLNRIIIQAAVDNETSNAVAKRAGFIFEGTLRQNELLDDVFHDENLYSLLKNDL
ncbi:GNAT family N-acetyltransferase [Companilactobacillus sp. HBUAS56275]|uniref:GNAT family N-acetyltransferase n=1 Tax=Candidatus Companilactobacillus pullicola TaxID=2838523 RepID=A0A9D1ZPR0_9LACO|nr:GNAT family N-acetyltransferase [Candidatus Companilactobacillus pullicola]